MTRGSSRTSRHSRRSDRGSRLAEIRTENVAGTKDYIEELDGARACIHVQTWNYDDTCVLCSEPRSYYDVAEETCGIITLSDNGMFVLNTAHEAEPGIEATFTVRLLAE